MAVRGMKKRIGDMLIEENLITQEQLERALEIARESGKKIGETLVENGYTTDEAIMRALSNQLGIEIVSLAGVRETSTSASSAISFFRRLGSTARPMTSIRPMFSFLMWCSFA